MKDKVLFVLPGYKESHDQEGYKEITKHAISRGYKVVPVSIPWKYQTMSQWVIYFKNIVLKYEGYDLFVVGFSFGAFIALVCSYEISFKKMILCSVSPYFKEDIKSLPKKAFKILGKKRMLDFKTIVHGENKKTEAIFFVGSLELPVCLRRSIFLKNKWKGKSRLKILEDTGHNISRPSYYKAVLDSI